MVLGRVLSSLAAGRFAKEIEVKVKDFLLESQPFRRFAVESSKRVNEALKKLNSETSNSSARTHASVKQVDRNKNPRK